ncbi:MAG: Flp family type IVb pilin [Bryobacterales bacterium]|nr:Flp family type IVb pilin [Bryobacterales bacterium]
MHRIINLVWKLRTWQDTRGRDPIEYTLMAGFVAVAAGAVMPTVADNIKTVFQKVSNLMLDASTRG